MKSKVNPRLLFFSSLIIFALTPALHAASGTWLGASGNWNATGTWNSGIIANGVDSFANFTGVDITADQTIALGVNRTIGNITFTDTTTSSNNLFITGNTLTLDVTAAAPVIDVTQNDRTLTIGSVIGGTDGLQKNGSGSLTLTAANTYTGATTVAAGILQLSGGSANLSASSAVTVSSGGQLRFQPSGDSGTYNYNSFDLNLTSSNVYFGDNNVNTYNLGGNVTVAGGVEFYTFGIQNTMNLGGTFSGTGDMSFVSQGAGFHTFVFSGDSSATGYTGSYKIYSLGAWNYARLSGGDNRLPITATVDLESQNGGTAAILDLNGNSQELAGLAAGGFTGNGWVQNSGAGTPTLTINNLGANTFAGKLGEGSTSFALTKAGAGTLTLSGANSYNGVTDITGGALRIQNNTALGQGGFSAATLTNLQSGASLEIDGSLTIDEHMHLAGSGDGGTGALRVLSGNSTFTNFIALDDVVMIDVAAGASLAQNNQFYDVGGLTKTGAGMLTLSGANSYSGLTYINGGALRIQNNTALGQGGFNAATLTYLQSGASLEIVGNLTIDEHMHLAGSGVGGNGAIRVLSGSSTFTTPIALDDIVKIDIAAGASLTQNNQFYDVGGVTKSGAGTLVLSGSNNYTGDTTVTGGSLAVSGSSIKDTNKLVINGGTVNLTGAETVNTLFFGAVQQAAGTYSATGAGGTIASANLTGSGTLVVTTSPAAGYASWMAPFITGGLTGNTTPTGDPDNDSMNNLLEYALNGNPSISDTSILPTLMVTATDFEFTYSRLDLSLTDTVQTFEYGSTLAGWTPVLIPAGPGVSNVGIASVTITNTGATDSIKVSIPRSASAGGKLFGHLKVVK